MTRPALPLSVRAVFSFGRLQPGRFEDFFLNDRRFHFQHRGRIEVNGKPLECSAGERFEVIPHSMRGTPIRVRRFNDGPTELPWRQFVGFVVLTPPEA